MQPVVEPDMFCPKRPRYRMQAHSQQYRQRPQHRRLQEPPQQPTDISLFAYQPPPSSSPREVASPSLAQPGTNSGTAAPQWQRHPQRGYQTGGGAYPDRAAGVATFATAAVGVPALGVARGAARSWDDVSRQRGKGRHASAGVGRPGAASGEAPGSAWALGEMQQGDDTSDCRRSEARGGKGGHAGALGGFPSSSSSSVVAPCDGYGDSVARGRGVGVEGCGRGGGTTSSFFGGASQAQLAAPDAPTSSFGRSHVAPQRANSCAATPSARNGKDGGGPAGGRRVGGMVGEATTAVVRNPYKPAHWSPAAAIAPIAVTVSRAGQPGLNPVGRSSGGGFGAGPGALVAEIGGSGGETNGEESSTGQSAQGASRAVHHGFSEAKEKRTGSLPRAATRSTPHRNGEQGRRLAAGGGAGRLCGDASTGSGGVGEEEGGGPEDVKAVAKKLDFRTVFD